ncbi:MAG TPA: aquaporin [Gemmatimonadales bacterium]|nr:aquaporin [Gemmatimonadales bacterium]
MTSLPRRALAEAFGTFGLIFFGCGAVVMNVAPSANYGLLGIALVHGLVLSVMVTATMSTSGGHINPAVTAGLFTARRIDGRTALVYILAQLVGAVLGALTLKALLPSGMTELGTMGTPALANSVTLPQAILIEAVLTFFLVSAVFGTAVAPDAPKVGGFAIGLVLFFDILVGGPLTGAAMNPARAFGPALVSGTWYAQLVWWAGPILGGIVAGVVWEWGILGGKR